MKTRITAVLLLLFGVPLFGQNSYISPQDMGGFRPPDKIDSNLPNVLILGDSITKVLPPANAVHPN